MEEPGCGSIQLACQSRKGQSASAAAQTNRLRIALAVEPAPPMTEPLASVPEPTVSAVAVEAPALSLSDVDRSCRVPVLVLLGAAAFWLGIGAVLAVISAI